MTPEDSNHIRDIVLVCHESVGGLSEAEQSEVNAFAETLRGMAEHHGFAMALVLVAMEVLEDSISIPEDAR